MKKLIARNRLSLFWRLFLSLLLTILFTLISSVLIERWFNERALDARMDVQVERLIIKRDELSTALRRGDFAAVREQYQQQRRFMTQISIFDEQGNLLFPKYHRKPRYKNHRDKESSLLLSFPSFITDPKSLIKDSITATSERPELASTFVTLPDGQTVTLQINPNLPFDEIRALERGNFVLRLLLIILFSSIVCFWLSRTLTRRMRHVQHLVRQLIDGNYQIDPATDQLGFDELGLLAKDVAKLSTRLADSELARKQMLSDISHELRSPLARLEVATELTRDFAPNAGRYLDRIDKESRRMNELIEEIIHIQSLQMQQYQADTTQHTSVFIADIIDEVAQDVCFEFQHKEVHWQWQPTAEQRAWCVSGNAEQLRRAFENVIRNAFIHTPAQSTVAVKLTTLPADKNKIAISISDEGEGIADNDAERIFQPFVRLDTARSRETGGYGLGLAIVHAVIMAHQGQVSAHNKTQSHTGLVVQIVLPRAM